MLVLYPALSGVPREELFSSGMELLSFRTQGIQPKTTWAEMISPKGVKLLSREATLPSKKQTMGVTREASLTTPVAIFNMDRTLTTLLTGKCCLPSACSIQGMKADIFPHTRCPTVPEQCLTSSLANDSSSEFPVWGSVMIPGEALTHRYSSV